jgi:hypothetical protein
VYNGNFDITRMLDQSNLSVQRCRLIFWVECSVGGYLALAKTIDKFTLPPAALPIGDTSQTHVIKLAAHSTTSPPPTTMRQIIYNDHV